MSVINKIWDMESASVLLKKDSVVLYQKINSEIIRKYLNENEKDFKTDEKFLVNILELEEKKYFNFIIGFGSYTGIIIIPFREFLQQIPLKQIFREFQMEIMSMLDCIKAGVWITDDEAISLAVNESSHHIVEKQGVERKNLVNRHMEDLVSEGYINHSAALIVKKENRECRIVQNSLHGKIQLYTVGVPYYFNNELQLIVCTDFDITEATQRRELFYLDQLPENIQNKRAALIGGRSSETTAKYLGEPIFASEKMKYTTKVARKVAVLDTTVLIQGETGTGKEVMADYIYNHSLRKGKPFVKINCSAIPENLLESELFGYVGGAFTGAKKEGKIGMFEQANGGTLFLDEIGDVPLNIQVKLLRAIQEREIYRVGSPERIPVDIRIIAASNKNLRREVEIGKFREDLYYRLNVVPIEIPPLRERKEDIIEMIEGFTNEFCTKYGFKREFNASAYVTLLQHSWPGNVRELRNVIERTLVMSDNEVIESREIFLEHNKKESDLIYDKASLKERTEMFEKELLEQMLYAYGSANQIADTLQVNRSTICRKLKQYGLDYSTVVDVG